MSPLDGDAPLKGRPRASIARLFHCRHLILPSKKAEDDRIIELHRLSARRPSEQTIWRLQMVWSRASLEEANWEVCWQKIVPLAHILLGRKDHAHSHFLLRSPT